MNNFPSGVFNSKRPEIEPQRILQSAKVIKELDPDVLLIQEIRDYETCEKLAEALQPDIYHVIVCSAFKNKMGAVTSQQLAILSKKKANTAFAEEWKTVGLVDPPRGFAFASFVYEANKVGIYSVHLKSNYIRGNQERGKKLNRLKRDLSAKQLIDHSDNVMNTLSLDSIIIGGDFNTTRDDVAFKAENTLNIIMSDRFRSSFHGTEQANRVTWPSNGRYPDATFDYIFYKNVDLVTPPLIKPSKMSDHRLVTCDIKLK